jgi:hypothetical protein
LPPPWTTTPRRSLGSVVALTAATASSRVIPPTSTPPTRTPARIRPEDSPTLAAAATLMVASSTTTKPATTATRCQPASPAERSPPTSFGAPIDASFLPRTPSTVPPASCPGGRTS